MRRRRRGEEGAVLLSDITAITGLAKGNGDVIHLQAPLLSSELKLRERERKRGRAEGEKVASLQMSARRFCQINIIRVGLALVVEAGGRTFGDGS